MALRAVVYRSRAPSFTGAARCHLPELCAVVYRSRAPSFAV